MTLLLKSSQLHVRDRPFISLPRRRGSSDFCLQIGEDEVEGGGQAEFFGELINGRSLRCFRVVSVSTE